MKKLSIDESDNSKLINQLIDSNDNYSMSNIENIVGEDNDSFNNKIDIYYEKHKKETEEKIQSGTAKERPESHINNRRLMSGSAKTRTQQNSIKNINDIQEKTIERINNKIHEMKITKSSINDSGYSVYLTKNEVELLIKNSIGMILSEDELTSLMTSQPEEEYIRLEFLLAKFKFYDEDEEIVEEKVVEMNKQEEYMMRSNENERQENQEKSEKPSYSIKDKMNSLHSEGRIFSSIKVEPGNHNFTYNNTSNSNSKFKDDSKKYNPSESNYLNIQFKKLNKEVMDIVLQTETDEKPKKGKGNLLPLQERNSKILFNVNKRNLTSKNQTTSATTKPNFNWKNQNGTMQDNKMNLFSNRLSTTSGKVGKVTLEPIRNSITLGKEKEDANIIVLDKLNSNQGSESHFNKQVLTKTPVISINNIKNEFFNENSKQNILAKELEKLDETNKTHENEFSEIHNKDLEIEHSNTMRNNFPNLDEFWKFIDKDESKDSSIHERDPGKCKTSNFKFHFSSSKKDLPIQTKPSPRQQKDLMLVNRKSIFNSSGKTESKKNTESFFGPKNSQRDSGFLDNYRKSKEKEREEKEKENELHDFEHRKTKIEFNKEMADCIREKINLEEKEEKYMKEENNKRNILFENDCLKQIPKINYCCDALKVDKFYKFVSNSLFYLLF